MAENLDDARAQALSLVTWQMSPDPIPPGRRDLLPPRLDVPPGSVVHLWLVPLDLSSVELDLLETTLSEIERERTVRFRFDTQRKRYIASHGWLRRILGGYLAIHPEALAYEHSARGKPSLACAGRMSGLEFNMAHSEHLALIAVGRHLRIGVDLEWVRPLEDAAELVARFFSKRESAAFQELPDHLKPSAFFNLWTRKEAWLKATGEGIAHLLDQVEVSFEPGKPAQLLTLPTHYSTAEKWSIYDIAVQPGFTAALAVNSTRVQPQLRSINDFKGVGL